MTLRIGAKLLTVRETRLVIAMIRWDRRTKKQTQ